MRKSEGQGQQEVNGRQVVRVQKVGDFSRQ
jgi:hypothetical protein